MWNGNDLISIIRAGALVNNATMSAAGKTGTELDIGDARQGTLVVVVKKGTTGIQNLCVYTDVATGASISQGVQVGAATRQPILQDLVNSTATLTVAAGGAINAAANIVTGIYLFHLPQLERFVNVGYTGEDSDTIVSMVLLAHGAQDQPFAAARAAYT
jgi:hypothetical protein